MATIDQVLSMLSWDSDKETQNKGISEAKRIKHISVLFQPIESKSAWENCARVIASKTDDTLEDYILRMFEWLQDMNWPGAQITYDRLLAMSPEKLEWGFHHSMKTATLLNDFSWKRSLLSFRQEYDSRHPMSIGADCPRITTIKGSLPD